MKRSNIIISLLISIIFISSCREINVSTVINKDGSFTRIITITGDSSEVLKLDLPYLINDTWKREFKKDTTNDKNYILTYTKSFSNSSLLNEEISRDTGWRKKLNRSIHIEKDFGFFYSYLTYVENISAANPFNEYDYKDYLNKEDILWLTGKKLALNSSDSTKIHDAEDKVDEYLQNALTDDIISVLKNGIKKLNNPTINPNQVDKFRDSISSRVHEWNNKSTYEYVNYFAKWTHSNDISELHKIDSVQFKILDNKMKLLLEVMEMEDYKVLVELPGIITETNSVSATGNQVSWSVNANSILLENFIMTVESRVINGWMFVITGIILLLTIVLIVIKFGR
mgnify:CR=1 FL=1|jgi:hypothetical protein